MRETRFWINLLFFILVFGALFVVSGTVLVVAFDFFLGLLFPYAVLASCAVLLGLAGLFLTADFTLARSLVPNLTWRPRHATLHSLVYAIEAGSGQQRTTGVRNA